MSSSSSSISDISSISEQKIYKISKIIQTCTACPSQWSARTTDDEFIYIRYRHYILTIDINYKNIFTQCIEKFENISDGCISFDELKILTDRVLDFTDISWIKKKNEVEY
jgi:hypothetical protein